MTKKEQKAMEEEARRVLVVKRMMRRQFLKDMEEFYKDCDAVKRVNKMNGVETTDEAYEKCLERYPGLTKNGFSLHLGDGDECDKYASDVFRFMRETEKIKDSYVGEDDIVVRDLESDRVAHVVLVLMMRRFGYTNILYRSNFSDVPRNVCNLVDMGCKVVGINQYRSYGPMEKALVLDIEDVNISSSLFEFAMEEKQELTRRRADWGMALNQAESDAIVKKYESISEKLKKFEEETK